MSHLHLSLMLSLKGKKNIWECDSRFCSSGSIRRLVMVDLVPATVCLRWCRSPTWTDLSHSTTRTMSQAGNCQKKFVKLLGFFRVLHQRKHLPHFRKPLLHFRGQGLIAKAITYSPTRKQRTHCALCSRV